MLALGLATLLAWRGEAVPRWLLGVVAADLEGHDRAAILERADSVLAKADTEISRYYLDQTEALAAAGIAQQPTLPGS